MINQIIFVALSSLIFIGLTYVLMRSLRSIGTKAKAADAPSRWNTSTKPAVGGIVFYSAFFLGMFFFYLQFISDRKFLFILSSGTIAFAVGLWDDVYRISASRKMIGQILCAAVFVIGTGLNLRIVGDAQGYLPDIILTMVFIVAMMNSINMLDNMDAVASIAALPVFVCFAIGNENWFTLWMLSSILGFLVFNRYPSKIFMGDSGSMLLGFVMAYLVISNTSYRAEFSIATLIFTLICTCSVFFADTIIVVVNRVRHSISPATGGRDHTSHNLAYLGLSENRIALLFLGLGMIQVLLFKSHANSANLDLFTFTVALIYFISYVLFMFWLTFINLKRGKFQYKK